MKTEVVVASKETREPHFIPVGFCYTDLEKELQAIADTAIPLGVLCWPEDSNAKGVKRFPFTWVKETEEWQELFDAICDQRSSPH
jgi:hypothetical protein